MSALKKKASAMAKYLSERLAIRLSSLTVTLGVDASGNPTIAIDDGSAATTEQNFFIRILELPSLGTDSVGNPQQSYGPHVIQLAMETSTVSALGFPTDANRLQVFGELLQTHCRVEVYLETNGTVPTVSSITAGNLKGTFEDLWFPPMIGV